MPAPSRRSGPGFPEFPPAPLPAQTKASQPCRPRIGFGLRYFLLQQEGFAPTPLSETLNHAEILSPTDVGGNALLQLYVSAGKNHADLRFFAIRVMRQAQHRCAIFPQ